MTEEYGKVVLWDNNPHEVESYASILEQYEEYLEDKPHKFTNLHIVDVELAKEAAIEIKRVTKKYNDIWRSLKDDSIHKQGLNMKENYEWFGYIFQIELNDINDMYFQDASKPYEERNITEQAYQTLCKTLEIRIGAHIFITRNAKETIDLVYEIWESLLKGEKYCTPENKTPRPKTLADNQIYFISSLYNTGNKKATELLEYFKTPERIMEEIDAMMTGKTKGSGKDKLIGKFPIKGFGVKWILANKELWTKEYKNDQDENN